MSGRLNSQSGRLSVIDQLRILSKFNLREDCFNRSDNVDFRPDALIHKARIAIQMSPSGRLPVMVQSAHSRYENYVLKFSRPDAHPPWFGHTKPFMEITSSGRATVRTTVSHRPDAALKQERFLSEIFRKICRTVFRPDGPCPPSRRHPHISLQSPILFLSL
jgi:hypothetical protein